MEVPVDIASSRSWIFSFEAASSAKTLALSGGRDSSGIEEILESSACIAHAISRALEILSLNRRPTSRNFSAPN